MTEWRNQAACRSSNHPEVFFPLTEQDVTAVNAAKAVCADCPVATDCLDEALTRGLDHGIFGGYTAAERRLLRMREVSR